MQLSRKNGTEDTPDDNNWSISNFKHSKSPSGCIPFENRTKLEPNFLTAKILQGNIVTVY